MELWDLYTKDRILTGQTMVRGDEVPEGRYHIVVHVCVFNDRGEMLIQQRQPFKEGWPGYWDFTMGGSAVSGETSETAAERELFEEVGIRLSFQDLRPSLTLHFIYGFDDIYLIRKDVDIGELRLQKEEVQAVRWASMEEIFRMVDEKTFIPYHKSLIELLFRLKDENRMHTYQEA